MDANEVFRIQDAVLILACSIDDFRREVLSLVSNSLTEGVLDRGIITINEMTVDELHR